MILDHPPGSPQRFVMSIKTLCRHTVPGAIRVLGYLVTTTCEVCGATVALATVEEVASARTLPCAECAELPLWRLGLDCDVGVNHRLDTLLLVRRQRAVIGATGGLGRWKPGA